MTHTTQPTMPTLSDKVWTPSIAGAKEQLRAQVSDYDAATGPTVAASHPGFAPAPAPAAEAPLRCPNCGLTLHPATIRHEQVLVAAACCPRCDGPLTRDEEQSVEAQAEPSIYLG